MALPLNIQLFAESGEGNTDPQQNGGTNPQEGGGNAPKTFTQADVDRIVNERTERAAKAALKSFYQQNGLSEEETAQAINAYIENKQKNNPEAVNAELQRQLAAAQGDLLRARVERVAEKAARDLGADEGSIEYVVRLADLSKVAENGEISKEKVSEAVQQVMNNVPAFKKQAATVQGVKIGGDNDGAPKDDRDARIRAAFGLK